MNAQDLYQHIKNGLNAFDLRFCDMEEMTVIFKENAVIFKYGKLEYKVNDE